MASSLGAGSTSQGHAAADRIGQTQANSVCASHSSQSRLRLRALPPTSTAPALAQQRQYSWSYSQTDSSQVNAYAARQVICFGCLPSQQMQRQEPPNRGGAALGLRFLSRHRTLMFLVHIVLWNGAPEQLAEQRMISLRRRCCGILLPAKRGWMWRMRHCRLALRMTPSCPTRQSRCRCSSLTAALQRSGCLWVTSCMFCKFVSPRSFPANLLWRICAW